MKNCLLLTLLLWPPVILFAQNDHQSEAVEKKIKEVECSLAGWVQPNDSARWNLKDRMAYHHVSGVSIAVIHNYKLVWAKGYGWADKARHRPVTTQTLFQAASMSKSLNGMGVMKLVQDNKLDLYTDINNYLRSWKFPYDSICRNKKITAATLLSHTAGLGVHGFEGYQPKAPIPDIYQVLDGKYPANSAPVRSESEPGIKAKYSGGGTVISQLMVMDITHMPYDKYMKESVLDPLDMKNSFFTQPPPEDKIHLLATGYRRDGTAVRGNYHVYPEEAPAGLWTNPTDFSKYVIETQLSYAGKSEKVLSQANTIIRLTPYIDANFAFGVFITKRGNTYFTHSGANEGFRCVYYGCLETGDGVVVMVNSDYGTILDEVVNSVATVYHWDNFYKPVKKNIIGLRAGQLQSYAGAYLLNGDTIRVVKKGRNMYIINGEMRWEMFFTSATDFFVYEYDKELQFVKSADKITGIKVGEKGMASRIY